MGILISQGRDWFFVVSEIANVQIEQSRLDLWENGESNHISVWYVSIGCKDAKRYTVGMFYNEDTAVKVVNDIIHAMSAATGYTVPKDERKD